MNVVDSSGWLEYFADGPNAKSFASPIEDPRTLVVPTLTIFEVFKRLLVSRGEPVALLAVALMHQGHVVDLTSDLALQAAGLSVEEGLPLADSVILATARARAAVLWTQDQDFAGRAGVRYFARAGARVGRRGRARKRGRS